MIFYKKKKLDVSFEIPKTRADVQLDKNVCILNDANANFTKVLEEYLGDFLRHGGKK